MAVSTRGAINKLTFTVLPPHMTFSSFNVLLGVMYYCEQVKVNLEMSFFEIYNEKIHDLLGQSSVRDKTTGKKSSVRVSLVHETTSV